MRCPVCRADNDDSDASCRRCRADLGLLVALEKVRSRLLREAQDHLCCRRPQEAMLPIKQAENLRHGTDANRLFALAHLLAGDFPKAWDSYQRTVIVQDE